MIKLNNKNITYIALADTNNSIKAPKEIWYADNNNSVKLVYRRKDTLIEGEDYEKYHWLKGDSAAYFEIPINIYQEPLFVKFHPTSSDSNHEFWRGFYKASSDATIEVRGMIGISNELGIRFGIRENAASTAEVIYRTGLDFFNDFTIETRYSEDNKVNYTFNGTLGTATPKIDSRANVNVQVSFKTTWCKFAKVTTARINLTPVRLLRPIPKWLDANGIRRQVGECGMIDLVSGKFYGNVNSSGTFTVENYYERKEWLIADIPVGVNMMTLPINSSTFSYQTVLGEQQANIGHFMTNGYSYVTNNNSMDIVKIYDNVNKQTVSSSNVNSRSMDIESSENGMTVNGVNIQQLGFPVKNKLITSASNSLNATTIKTSKITVNNKERYIPCTLTMDLPASMDANNIARTKGTSGMWDLVSDRFYGNVANSGTFKAVNLAEGVDYEVHQWLIASTQAKLGGITYNLWVNKFETKLGRVKDIVDSSTNTVLYYRIGDTSDIFFDAYKTTGQNPNYFLVRFREASQSNQFYSISPYSSMPDEVTMSLYIDNGTAKGVINGNQIVGASMAESLWNKENGLMLSGAQTRARIAYIREVLPNDTYRSNLVPVKLLKSIPSKYDANGIARQVGECGMYDTVNDVFYGNVASSGTFSVSDN